MDWFKAYSDESERPEAQGLTDAAFRLWYDGRCYIARNESDGFIPGTQLPRFGRHGSTRNARALVDAGFWLEAPTGWIDPRWEHEQKSAADMEANRKRTADRVRRFRNSVGNAVTNDVGNAAGNRTRGREEVDERSSEVKPRRQRDVWDDLRDLRVVS